MKGHLTAFSIYIIIVLVVMFSWFHNGLMYGGGDIGLPTYNPQRFLGVILKPWWSETAPGIARPQSMGSIPVQVIFTLLQLSGFPSFMIEAIIFGFLLFMMGFGMYLLANQFTKGQKVIAFLAGLFYMINPFMMVLVWHRFIFTTFFFAASLPILLLFWRKWIRKNNFSSLILFIIVNALFSYMFTTMAYVINLWLLLFVYTLFEAIVPWLGWKKAIKIFAFFCLGLVFWFLTNTWWIIPVFFVLPSLVSVQHSVNNTLSTLFEIGNQSIIPYSLAGLNSFYLFTRQELGDVFRHPLFLSISYIGVFFITIGIYYASKKRELVFWSILFIAAVFLAKGVASPFGYFYPYLFEKFFFLGLLRNPFEKLGLLIPFAGSMLFAIGFFNLASYFWKKNYLAGKAILILCFGLFFGVYHWPFWAGTLFGTLEKRNFVEIPQYYEQANQWIKAQHMEGDILHLPLVVGDSSTYRWKYGYSGLESNVNFFTSNPSISMGFNLAYLDNALNGFNVMANFDSVKYREHLKELFRAFNVRFIVLHNDINWQASGVQSPEKIGKILDSLPFLIKQKKFGELTIYEIDDSSFLSKINISSSFDYLDYNPTQETDPTYNAYPWFIRSDPKAILLSDNSSNKELIYLSADQQKILVPVNVIETPSVNLASIENSLNELPPARFLPDSPFYSLIILKEFIQAIGYQKTKENIQLIFAGKRLVEIYKMQEKNPKKSISPVILRYVQHLDKGVAKIFNDGLISAKTPTELKILFARHELVLGQIYQNAKEEDKAVINKALENLRRKMIEMNMQTIFELKDMKEQYKYDRRVYRFIVPVDGEYEILMADSKVFPIYQQNLNQLDLQIDNIIQSRAAQIKNDLISYGTIFLQAGQHEVSFYMQNSVNLIKDKQEEVVIVSGQHNLKTYNLKIEQPAYPNSTYLLSFEYWIQKGSNPVVRVLQDSDPENYLAADELNKQRDYQFMRQVESDSYDKYWRTYNIYISPRKNSSNFSFQFISIPWNDCRSILSERSLCNNPQVQFNFQKPSTVVIRNIKVNRVLDNAIFLRSKEKDRVIETPLNLTYIKTKPLVYEGSVTIDKPSIMVFNETFNYGWELIMLYKNNQEYKPPKHFFANIYGNGWLLEQNGTYKFRISFSPQKYFYLGAYISIFSFVIFIVVFLVNIYWKRNHEKNN